MTQKDKQLLLKDLCARLPYGVKVYNTTFKEPTIQTLYGKISSDEFLMEETYTSVGVDGDDFGPFNKRHYTGYIDFIKPYLRPMSSMTEEEKQEQYYYKHDIMYQGIGAIEIYMNEYINWLDSNHFDWRMDGNNKTLIERGLALVAPEGMYKIKEK